MVLFQRSCLWSGQTIYDMWALSAFNFFCGAPILLIGVFDRDLSKEYVARNPQTFRSGMNKQDLNFRVLLRWSIAAVLYAVVIFYGASLVSGFGSGTTFLTTPVGNAEGGGLAVFGTVIFLCLVMAMTLKAIIETKTFVRGEGLRKLLCCELKYR